MYDKLKQMDSKEIQLPETTYIRDIESRVFQGITLRCLAKIEGISLLEGNIIDSLLGREVERIKGIHVEQDQQKHSVNLRVEINIEYGISIPKKAEEIQNKIAKEITDLTGLHVSCVHIIFKNLIHQTQEDEEELEFSEKTESKEESEGEEKTYQETF